jgi:hypothetical protein
MCEVFGVASGWWSISGLVTDFVGVCALGVDLIRLQRTVRQTATENLSKYKELEEQLGGIPSWIEDLEKSVKKWIPESAYSDHHAEDEVSYNARHLQSTMADLANASAGLGTYVAALAETASARAADDAKVSKLSLLVSFVGLGLILLGFIMQTVGSLPCAR